MKNKENARQKRRKRIKKHIRKRIQGTSERPRLTVYRSLKSIYAQLVDDSTGKTILSVSSISKDLRDKAKKVDGKIDVAKMVGQAVGEAAIKRKIKKVVFDRNGYLYHGRVKALADAAREAGLEF
jgi:large subunit ribosomal protein L18